uniref:Uncharacterized protein n=1 Tax=Cacopsylla melanoneura TaxID=428564 RepID=A0A8D8ZJ08_9HEMI
MSSDDLDEQTTVISKSIKDILEFTLNREMKMKCFELLQVDNTYDFTEELKSKLQQSVLRRSSSSPLNNSTTVTSSPGSTSHQSQQLFISASNSQKSQQHVGSSVNSQNISSNQSRRVSGSQSERVSSMTSSQFSQYRENSCVYNSASGSSEPSSSSSSGSNTQDSQSQHLRCPSNPDPNMNQSVNGQRKKAQDRGNKETKLVSNEDLKSNSQIMTEFLQDIEMLENL